MTDHNTALDTASAKMNTIKASALAALNDKGNKGLRELAGSRGNVLHVNPYLIQDSGTNVRRQSKEFKEKLYELARQIAAQGVLQPMTVYTDGNVFKVSDGHRRLAATMIAIEEMGAEIETVPVIPTPRGSNDADHKFDQFIRNTGEPLTVLETAMLFKDMIGMGWSIDKIVKRSGKEPAFVYRMIETAELPHDIHTLIEDGKVKATFALERHRANNFVTTATVSEINATYDAAKTVAIEAGKDVEKVRATAKNLPETAPMSGRALSNETRRRKPDAAGTASDAAPVVHADKGKDDTAPAATADKAPTMGAIKAAFSRHFRHLPIEKYERDGSPLKFGEVPEMQQADWDLIRDYLGL